MISSDNLHFPEPNSCRPPWWWADMFQLQLQLHIVCSLHMFSSLLIICFPRTKWTSSGVWSYQLNATSCTQAHRLKSFDIVLLLEGVSSHPPLLSSAWMSRLIHISVCIKRYLLTWISVCWVTCSQRTWCALLLHLPCVNGSLLSANHGKLLCYLHQHQHQCPWFPHLHSW